MIITCKNWKPSDEFFRGVCTAGKYEGRPTFGQCVDWCKECTNTRQEMDEYINTLAKKEQSPEQKVKREKQQKKREAERQRLLDQLPGTFQMTRNLERHLKDIAVHYLKTGRTKVPDWMAQQRLKICNNCPDDKMVIDKKGAMRCTLQSCGCYLDNPNNRKILDGKAYYEALTCDNGHWPRR